MKTSKELGNGDMPDDIKYNRIVYPDEMYKDPAFESEDFLFPLGDLKYLLDKHGTLHLNGKPWNFEKNRELKEIGTWMTK